MQLSVPVFAAIGGVVFLGEAITLHFFIASTVVIAGIAVMMSDKSPSKQMIPGE